MRLLPDRLKAAAWGRMYRGSEGDWPHLFRDAPLRFAPTMTTDLVLGDVISSSIAFTGFYELVLSRYVRDVARRGGTMIDVGANLGYFSLLWAGVNDRNRCVSFEASPRVAALLQHNVRKNRLESRVEMHALAAGRERGRLDFHLGPADQTGWGGFSPPTPETVSVDVIRVDEVVPAEPVALLKIDAEGADTWVLMGCEKLLQSRLVGSICYEQNRPRMRHLGIADDEAMRFLESVGYVASPRTDPTRDNVEWFAAPG
ncbi:MAG: FkbM family methyltransferase [Gemmatimonadales bacterium]